MPDDVRLALRLGWTVAEVRGRTWRPRPEPEEPRLPDAPLGMLPLRSQRESAASEKEAVATLRELVTDVRITDVDPLLDDVGLLPWPEAAGRFVTLDRRIQRQLTGRDEDQATAYLLGRGLAECYWSYGGASVPEPGAQLRYLFGDRVDELTRMLGRLPAGQTDPLTPSAVAGSLEAWRAVAVEDDSGDVAKPLREQVRRWYQLVVLGQDPTTLVTPSRRLGRRHYLGQLLRTFWPQVALAVLALALTSTFFASFTDHFRDLLDGLQPYLGGLGVGTFAAAGLLAKAQSAAQRVVTRMRQDEYTDLVAVSVSSVPDWVPVQDLEAAVRRRHLTPSTPPLPTG